MEQQLRLDVSAGVVEVECREVVETYRLWCVLHDGVASRGERVEKRRAHGLDHRAHASCEVRLLAEERLTG